MGTIATRPRWPTRPRCAPILRVAELPPGELAADWIMMVLVNAEMEELDIRPTHRLVRDGTLRAGGVRGASRGTVWQTEPMAAEERSPPARSSCAVR